MINMIILILLLIVCVLLLWILKRIKSLSTLDDKIEQECATIVQGYMPIHNQIKQIVEDMLEMESRLLQCHKEALQSREADGIVLSKLNNNTDQLIQVVNNLQGSVVALDKLIRDSIKTAEEQKPAGVKFKFGQANYKGGR